MNVLAFSKTLLNIYNCLELVVKRIDDFILKKTNSAAQAQTLNFEKSFEEIANLSDRKNKLINIKIYIEQAMLKLKPEYIKILYLKFFDRFSSSQIADALSVCERTYFRKSKDAIFNFAQTLKKVGINEKVMNDVFVNDDWIKKIYLYFCDDLNECRDFYNVSYVKPQFKQHVVSIKPVIKLAKENLKFI